MKTIYGHELKHNDVFRFVNLSSRRLGTANFGIYGKVFRFIEDNSTSFSENYAESTDFFKIFIFSDDVLTLDNNHYEEFE